MAITIVDGPTILLGESLSDAADCSAGNIVRITVPQEFTPANLTFQVSSDGNLFNDLFDSRGGEVTVVAKPNTSILISEAWGRSINFVKFRSGSRDHPVLQTRDDCRFGIAVETSGAMAGTAALEARSAERVRRDDDPDPRR
jgi:hypothetical protein